MEAGGTDRESVRERERWITREQRGTHPGSMQTMVWYSSSPKSPMFAAFASQGFHTTQSTTASEHSIPTVADPMLPFRVRVRVMVRVRVRVRVRVMVRFRVTVRVMVQHTAQHTAQYTAQQVQSSAQPLGRSY
jgi:hypothetical protein